MDLRLPIALMLIQILGLSSAWFHSINNVSGTRSSSYFSQVSPLAHYRSDLFRMGNKGVKNIDEAENNNLMKLGDATDEYSLLPSHYHKNVDSYTGTFTTIPKPNNAMHSKPQQDHTKSQNEVKSNQHNDSYDKMMDLILEYVTKHSGTTKSRERNAPVEQRILPSSNLTVLPIIKQTTKVPQMNMPDRISQVNGPQSIPNQPQLLSEISADQHTLDPFLKTTRKNVSIINSLRPISLPELPPLVNPLMKPSKSNTKKSLSEFLDFLDSQPKPSHRVISSIPNQQKSQWDSYLEQPRRPNQQKSQLDSYLDQPRRPYQQKSQLGIYLDPHRRPNQQPECMVGSKWQSNCHDCTCNSQGYAECKKKFSCFLRPRGEPMTCKPYSEFDLNECNKCKCNGDGVPICTLSECSKYSKREHDFYDEDLISLLEQTDGKKSAPPSFKFDIQKYLDQNANTKMDVKFKDLPKCASGTRWRSNCYDCVCDKYGKRRCVRILECRPLPYGVPGHCMPNTSFRRYCGECTCDDEGKSSCSSFKDY